MRDIVINKIDSFRNTLNVADQPEFAALWTGRDPSAFEEGLNVARGKLTKLTGKGAEQQADISGNTKALRDLRKRFSARLHVLARATYQTLAKNGRTEDAAKVNFTPSDYIRARASALAGMGETVLDLAEPLSVPPAGGGVPLGKARGVTPTFVAAVDDLWDEYSVAVGAPAGARAKRKALGEALPGDVRALEADFADLDDLVIQFDDGDGVGHTFVEAWFNARHVNDLGRRAAKPAAVAKAADQDGAA